MDEAAYRQLVSEGIYTLLHGFLCSESSESEERLGRLNGLPEALATRVQDGISAARSILVASFPTAEQLLIDAAFLEILGDINGIGDTSNSGMNGSEFAETEDLEGLNGAPKEPTEGLKGLLYYIAEEDARRKAYEHRGIHCEDTCEATSVHPKTHVFAKIKIPLPSLSQPGMVYPIWYPGDPRKMHSPLDAGVRKRMSQESGFEEPTVDALYDQFTCIANIPWTGDPAKVQAAIDKRAFNKALTSERWPQRYAPNAIYDRMFAFYDDDGNGLIGFEEFIRGLAYLRGPKRFASLRRAIQGFDLDGDGYIDRVDMVRLFEAKYLIQRQLVSDMIEGHEGEHTMASMDVLRSSQPISSIFNQEEIPQGEDRPRRGKQLDCFGDMQPLPGTKTILDDNDLWPHGDETRREDSRNSASHDRLRHHLSRFEEMMYGPAGTDGPAPSPHISGEVRPQSAEVVSTQQSLLPQNNRPEEGGLLPDGGEGQSDPDALWHIVRAGLNEMLNPIFEAKEIELSDIIKTKGERSTWRPEIELALKEKQAFQEELHAAALVDPLMATALKSSPTVRVEMKLEQGRQQSGQQVPEPAFRGDIVSTDPETLARREAAIAQRPLEDLLNATGYGMVETREHNSPEAAKTQQNYEIAADPAVTAASEPSEGRLDAPSPSMVAPLTSGEPELVTKTTESRTPPSRQRLEYLASLDSAERENEERGGGGRLSFDEIESMVRADTTREVRGLVTSWLEWASF
ncbi:hypothetical protein LTR36_002881 [Oleoguttula mirabilis]|uniref:EF-hand domain-containing protein n=1 Tax=Oleoguttula mirabilis TaxID=1507867 RepID=A0AAV9JJQ8_9PEZI|nr:hypothetical protein LTR36_002881 [Oleoguttula mirabilis]